MKTPKIHMHPVKASQSASHTGYDAATKTLAVQFKGSGAPYYYKGVESSTDKDLLAAESFGRFLQANIVGKYSHTRPQETDNASPLR